MERRPEAVVESANVAIPLPMSWILISVKIDIVWGAPVQRLVGTRAIVFVEPLATAFDQLLTVSITPEVDVLIFVTAPESLDEDVIDPAALAVHAHEHLIRLAPPL